VLAKATPPVRIEGPILREQAAAALAGADFGERATAPRVKGARCDAVFTARTRLRVRDELHAAIARAAFVGCVVGDRLVGAVAGRGQARRRNAARE